MKCTVGDISEFYQQNPDCIGKIKVETRHGFYDIEWADITAYDSPILKIETEEYSLEGSPDHKILVNNEWKKLKDCRVGDIILTKTGNKGITQIFRCEFTEDLYDLQVKTVKEYYTNGIVSHNSTFLDAITFALFGRAYRFINKPRIPNSINDKDCQVEIKFTIGNTRYLIKRGLKPAIFEIYCDDVLLNQEAKNLDYQKHLEQNILKLNFDSFSQLVVLGSANYIPFMQLTTSQRREVIEELLDLKVFTRMNSVLKEKYSLLREDIKDAETKLISNKDKFNLQQNHIDKLKAKNNQDKEEKEAQIRDIENTVSDLIVKNKEFLLKLQQKKTEMDGYISGNNPTELINTYDNLKSSIFKESKEFVKKKEFYETNDCCPTCKQSIDIKFKDTALESLEGKIQESDRAIVSLTNRISKQKERQKVVNQYIADIQDINAEIAAINIKISEANNYISKLRSSLGLNMDDMIRSEELKSTQIKDEISKNEKDKEFLMEKKYDYDTIQILLKDSGIKSKIIKQYLPLMNKYINKYLASMDFFVNFNLDDGFKERIKSRHRDDFEYNSFSEGEKFRIDMALMLTWREIARAKNSTNTNLLILDEVFDGSLDSSGTEEFLKLLRQLSTNTHIFVISHKGDILTDKFDRSIRVDKKNNFSRMV